MLAPNAKLRAHVEPQGSAQLHEAAPAVTEGETPATDDGRPGRISWARLLMRVFDIDMRHCPSCSLGEMKIIAAILEPPISFTCRVEGAPLQRLMATLTATLTATH